MGRELLSLMRPSQEEALVSAIGRKVGLSPNDPTLAIEALSGGNQQKVVVGRWLGSGRRLLIAEDPTAGVDVGAKAEIYHLLYDALSSGMGVLVVSTDFEEIANICHRAIIFSRGKPVAELSGVELSTESLIQAASAGEAA
jgi:ribose transport system ATP-binding protein